MYSKERAAECKRKVFTHWCACCFLKFLIGLILIHFTMRLCIVFWCTKETCRLVRQFCNHTFQDWKTQNLQAGFYSFYSGSKEGTKAFDSCWLFPTLILLRRTATFGLLRLPLWTSMDDLSRLLGSEGRPHSESFSSDATQSTSGKVFLRHRLNQLVTCVDDWDPENELHEKVVKTLDNAFIICGMKANKQKKDRIRWRTNVTSLVFSVCWGRTQWWCSCTGTALLLHFCWWHNVLLYSSFLLNGALRGMLYFLSHILM